MSGRENRAVVALRRVLNLLPAATRVLDTPNGPVMLVEAPGFTYELVPIWAGEGFPRDVRVALSLNPVRTLATSQIPVLVAGRMSPGAQTLLAEQGLSWADEQGAAQLAAPPALLVTRVAAIGPAGKRPGFRWTPSAGAVAEQILTMFGAELKDIEPPSSIPLPPTHLLAASLPVSLAQVSRVLQAFDAQGWTRKVGSERGTGAERRLLEPSALLSAWAQWQAQRTARTVRTHATWQDPDRFLLDRLAPVMPHHAWCLTGWLAASRLAPFTTTVPSITCYLEPDAFDEGLPRILEAAGLRVVESGARVIFKEAEPQVLTLARSDSVPMASGVRIYADLLTAGARGEDAANHLREVVLGY